MLLLCVFCVLSRLGTLQACMPSTRLTSYMPTIYWWHSNVTALNQTIPQLQNLTTQQQQFNKTSVSTRLPTINSPATSAAPLTPELLPIEPSRSESHQRTMYTRRIASPEIPMPEPAFVVKYQPPPILVPPNTENPNILWDRILSPKHHSKLPSEEHDSTKRWWVSIAVKATARPNSQVGEEQPRIVNVPVADPNEIVSVNTSEVPTDHSQMAEATTTEDDLLSESSEMNGKLDPLDVNKEDDVNGGVDVNKKVYVNKKVDVNEGLDVNEGVDVDEKVDVDKKVNVDEKVDVSKKVDMKNVMSVDSSTQRGNGTQGSDDEASETTVAEHSASEGATHTEQPTSVATTEFTPPISSAVTENISSDQDTEPPSEQVVAAENVTGESPTETPVIEATSSTSRPPATKRPKFERPFNAHEEIVTQRSRIPNSFIHTMPPNSVILIVEGPNDKEQIINALKATTADATEEGGSLAEKLESTPETPPQDVTNTTERLDVPTATLQIGNDTYRLSSDLLNVTQSLTDSVTEQMITETTGVVAAAAATAAAVIVDSSTTDSSPSGEPTVSPVYIASSTNIPDDGTTVVLDSFRGSLIDASSTDSSKDAIEVSESPTRDRIVNEEDVLLDKIPHSVPVEEKSKEREDAMQSDSIISSVMEIINASSKSEARRKAPDQVATQARTRKLSNADISYRIDWQVEPETTWLAEGVLLPNGTSVIVPKEGIRGVPGVLPLPPAPDGVAMQTSKIQMRRQRLIDGKKILVATIPQENPENPPLVYYYWKEPRTRRYVLVDE